MDVRTGMCPPCTPRRGACVREGFHIRLAAVFGIDNSRKVISKSSLSAHFAGFFASIKLVMYEDLTLFTKTKSSLSAHFAGVSEHSESDRKVI
jgi:hypothetical protein